MNRNRNHDYNLPMQFKENSVNGQGMVKLTVNLHSDNKYATIDTTY